MRNMNMDLNHIHILVDIREISYDINILYNIISNLKESPISFHFVPRRYYDLSDFEIESLYEVCDYAIDLSDNPNLTKYIEFELPVLVKKSPEINKLLIELPEDKVGFIKNLCNKSYNENKSEVILIFGHFNSDDKIDLLKEGITSYKKMGYDIILSTNSLIPNDIYDLVDYVIYDKENPVVNKEDYSKYNISPVVFWSDFGIYKQKISAKSNYNYAVVKLIKNGLSVSKTNSYEKTHIINYDYIIYDHNLIKSNSDYLNQYDLVLYDCLGTGEWVNASFYSLNNKIINKLDIFNINSREDYYSRGYNSIFEIYLKGLFSNFNHLLLNQSEIYYRNIIDFVSTENESPHRTINYEDKKTYLNISKDSDDNYYLFYKTNDDISLNLNIGEFFITLTNKFYIISLELEDLKNGVVAEIIKYDHKSIFDINSQFANCEIPDKNIVIKIK